MPIYEYEVLSDDGEPLWRFEVLQQIKDPPLTREPVSGRPVRRVVCAPRLNLRYSKGRTSEVLGHDNLSRNGFTKYEKSGEGTYRRTAGIDGPDTLG
jgi:hypothetical protein